MNTEKTTALIETKQKPFESPMQAKYLHSELTEKVIAACLEVHKELGPGFQESIYHNALMVAFKNHNLPFETEKQIEIRFHGELIGIHRLDLTVSGAIVVEIKAIIGKLPEVFKSQVISYLKASGLEVRLLVNFGNEKLKVQRLARYKNYHLDTEP
jgi:GxxExxY protein